ncbi:hypothetical protein DPMN_055713 [Dreissena polymorpha]|uniref:Carboxylesterase type B domain-containing protein n=3 Tax=Dreissena polymorpha TaxID=45954 RepID=A0A9D4CQG1_DREPO|nr:hypothetical protein DPMN_055713 [Dreissena polymorpha]
MWTNFAKSGDPNKPEDARQFTNATWAEYDLDFQSFLQFTYQGALPGSQFQARRMQLWSDLLPTSSKRFQGIPWIAQLSFDVHWN